VESLAGNAEIPLQTFGSFSGEILDKTTKGTVFDPNHSAAIDK
jgi:hypothetical protein